MDARSIGWSAVAGKWYYPYDYDWISASFSCSFSKAMYRLGYPICDRIFFPAFALFYQRWKTDKSMGLCQVLSTSKYQYSTPVGRS